MESVEWQLKMYFVIQSTFYVPEPKLRTFYFVVVFGVKRDVSNFVIKI